MNHFREEQKTIMGDGETGSKKRNGRQKVRIKYKQRVKIKKRPRGFKIRRYWKRNRKNLFSYLVLVTLLGTTFYLVYQYGKQELERKQHEQNQRLRLK